jgi:hypothetical protein
MSMHKFCDMRSISYKTRSDLRREPISDCVRFCFGDPAHAHAFTAEFGGEPITVEPSENWSDGRQSNRFGRPPKQ